MKHKAAVGPANQPAHPEPILSEPKKRPGRRLAKCPKSIEPLFRRVYDAQGIGPSRAAIYDLAHELYRRGQSGFVVEHTLRLMRPDLGEGIVSLAIIARVTQAQGLHLSKRRARK